MTYAFSPGAMDIYLYYDYDTFIGAWEVRAADNKKPPTEEGGNRRGWKLGLLLITLYSIMPQAQADDMMIAKR